MAAELLDKKKNSQPTHHVTLQSSQISLNYSEDKHALHLNQHHQAQSSGLAKSSHQSSLTKTFLSSQQPSYMQHTKSSMVKERQVQEDEAQDILTTKASHAKNKKMSFGVAKG